MNIFLIGFRCTGKTTVGQILAARLKKHFVDTDQQFVSESGLSIEKAVARFGWDYFRQWEKEIIIRLCSEKEQVVATGGGAIMNPASVAKMNQSGKVIWLRAMEDTVLRRMARDQGTSSARPSLTGRSHAEEVKVVMAQRTPHYRKVADYEVMTDRRSPESIANKIKACLITGS